MHAGVVTVTGVSKLYGMFAALRHVDYSLPRGQCHVLLGENGAGKSTLLRVIAGLLAPTVGTVDIFSKPPQEVRDQIGYMSHAPMLYEELTARENLTYFASLYNNASALTPDEALEAVDLDPNLKRPVSQYSQGMRQRASLARAILAQPKLLLLDEPFSNLDVDSAGQLVSLIGNLPGCSVILTTHQRALAEPIAHRLITMQAGSVVKFEDGPRAMSESVLPA
jgi:heme ABC exporter ATP-binding subunit CcmA